MFVLTRLLLCCQVTEWCVHQVRAALDEVDVITTELRERTRSNGSQTKTARELVCKRLGDLTQVVVALLGQSTATSAPDAVLRLVVRLFKSITKTARVVSARERMQSGAAASFLQLLLLLMSLSPPLFLLCVAGDSCV